MALPIIPIAIGGALIYMATKKKGPDLEDFDTDVRPGSPPPGVPEIQIRKMGINRVFNSLKFDVFLPDGEKLDFKTKLKKGDSQFKLAGGKNWLIIDVMEHVDSKGRRDPMGAVMVVLTDSRKRPITAKRVLMNEKKIIDVQ